MEGALLAIQSPPRVKRTLHCNRCEQDGCNQHQGEVCGAEERHLACRRLACEGFGWLGSSQTLGSKAAEG